MIKVTYPLMWEFRKDGRKNVTLKVTFMLVDEEREENY